LKCHILSLTLLLIPLTGNAQNHLQLSSGLTASNSNLFSQKINSLSNNNTAEQRLGLQLSISSHWQRLNNSGGLTVSAYAHQDSALENQNSDIQQLNLQGQKLLALNATWLSRTQLNGSHYDNQQRPSNSYQSLEAKQTLGYFSSNNSGWDLSIGLQQRTYPQNPSGTYNGQQFELGSVYYFANPLNTPRWAAAITLQQFNASDTFYNSNSQQLDLSYGQWQWHKLQGNVSFQWLQNQYPNTVGQLSDRYSLISLDGSYPITTQWQLTSTVTSGLYQASNTSARTIINAYLGLRLSL